MEIFSCYKYGSKAERESGETGLNLQHLTLIGLTFQDLLWLYRHQQLDQSAEQARAAHVSEVEEIIQLSQNGDGAFVPLSTRDISKCNSLLAAGWVTLEPIVQ